MCDFVHREVQSLMFPLLLCVRTMKRIGAILTAVFPEYAASTMSGLPPLRRIKVFVSIRVVKKGGGGLLFVAFNATPNNFRICLKGNKLCKLECFLRSFTSRDLLRIFLAQKSLEQNGNTFLCDIALRPMP